MKRNLALGAVAASLVLAGACGGKVIFEASTGSGGTGGTTSTQFATSTQNVGVTNGVTTVGTNGVTTGTNVGVTSGSVMSSGSNNSASVSAVSAVSTTGSGPPPPPPSPIFCNGAPCGGSQICCFNPSGPGDHCGDAGQCDPGYVEVTCTGPGDCPGAFCCATITGNSVYQGIACQPQCNGPNEFIMCSLDPLACPAGTKCHQSVQLGTPYRLCY